MKMYKMELDDVNFEPVKLSTVPEFTLLFLQVCVANCSLIVLCVYFVILFVFLCFHLCQLV